MLAQRKIAEADLDLLMMSDSPSEVRDLILRSGGDRQRAAQEADAREVTREYLGRK